MPPSDDPNSGYGLAVTAESLYLANLLLIPGLAFVVLLWLWLRHRNDGPALARAHLAQTVSGSVWAGMVLVIAVALILLFGGFDGPQVWTVTITYFTVFHSMFIVFGAYGLAKAMAKQCWRFPLVGRPLPENCPQ